jgi:predicted dinucleotide-binding enzyme
VTAIGFIGSGHIGGTVARLAVAAGHDVVLSNKRGPESLQALVAELGPHARAATGSEAAQAGDIVVVTIPYRAHPQVPAEPLRGKVVIDTTNYYARDGHFAELDSDSTTSSALLQAHLSGSRVVKAFNTIASRSLATLGRPAGTADRTAMGIAGDDAEAKAAVVALLDSVGYDAYDVGTLADSRALQPGSPAYNHPATAAGIAKLIGAAR